MLDVLHYSNIPNQVVTSLRICDSGFSSERLRRPVMNKNRLNTTNSANELQRFVRAIKEELDAGYSLIPLAGAGMSVASGIPAINELRQYLAYCVVRAIEDPEKYLPGYWPPLHELRDPENTEMVDQFMSTISNCETNPGTSKQIRQEAFGSMADWRLALQFLSRLQYRQGSLMQVAPDSFITDSFFLQLVKDSEPNLAHRMIPPLCDVFNSNLLLTTNFDQLLETAFSAAKIALTPFDVHIDAGLPDARTVRIQRSLIKLHGGRYGLRANYSLDAVPSLEDQRTMTSYFANAPFNVDDWVEVNHKKRNNNSHLIAMGTSGNDTRMRILINTAMQRLPSMKIFWLAHTESGADAVRKHFQYDGRVHILQNSNLGMTLLHIYQNLTGAIPASGIEYPAIWQLPLNQTRLPNTQNPKQTELYQNTVGQIVGGLEKSEANEKLIVIESKADVDGATSAAAAAFSKLEGKANCVWLELDDFERTEEVLTWLTTHLSQRTGKKELLPVALRTTEESLAKEVRTYCRWSSKPWYIFMDARSGAGANVGTTDKKPFPHDVWGQKECDRFWEAIEDLLVDHCGTNYDRGQKKVIVDLRVVVARYDTKSLSSDIVDRLEKSGILLRITIPESCIEYDRKAVVENVIGDLSTPERPSKDTRKALFVYAMLLCRRLRYRTLVRDEMPEKLFTIMGDYAPVAPATVDDWIATYERLGLLATRQGGFLGVDRVVREKLRCSLLTLPGIGLELKKSTAQIHTMLADWLQRLYVSSLDPFAAFESIHHRCCAAMAAADEGDVDISEAQLRSCVDTLVNASRQMEARGQSTIIREHIRRVRTVIGKVIRSAKRSHARHNSVAEENVVDIMSQRLEALKSTCSRVDFNVAMSAADFRESKKILQLLDYGSDQEGDRARLCLGLRAYERASDIAISSLKAKGFPDLSGPLYVVANKAYKWAVRTSSLDSGDRLIYASIVELVRYGHANLLLAQAVFYSTGRDGLHDWSRRRMCNNVRLAHGALLETLRLIDDNRATQRRIESLTQVGLAEAMLGDFELSKKRFVEARGFAGSVLRRPFSILPAVLDMMEAEAGLIEISKDRWFSAIRPLLWRVSGRLDRDEASLRLLDCSFSSWSDHFRRVNSLLWRVEMLTSRARVCLSGHRRNVPWWTKLYELECKVSEFRLFCDCISRMLSCTTEAYGGSGDRLTAERLNQVEALVGDACRIVRVDVLQCARILESCVSHCKLLEWAFADSYPESYSSDFRNALNQLAYVLKKSLLERQRIKSVAQTSGRSSVGRQALNNDFVLSPYVLAYVEHVLDGSSAYFGGR